MTSPRQDLIATFGHGWQRFRRRTAGLGDAELRWRPVADERLSLSWRLRHIADLLWEDRNAAWLGVEPATTRDPDGRGTLADLERGYEHLTGLLRATTDALRAALDDWER